MGPVENMREVKTIDQLFDALSRGTPLVVDRERACNDQRDLSWRTLDSAITQLLATWDIDDHRRQYQHDPRQY